MRALSAQDLIDIWERGHNRHLVDRALLLLKAGWPDMSSQQLAELNISERDHRLFALRCQTLGPRLDVYTACPQCGGSLEVALDSADLLASLGDEPTEAEQVLEWEDYRIHCRLPNSHDLAAAATSADSESARQLLQQRCLQCIGDSSGGADTDRLPAHVMDAVSKFLVTRYPWAEIELELQCPHCRHGWSSLLDIVAFFWSEVSVLAKRLLAEVHLLARAYGWREADILSMSATRRRTYLEMVT